MSCYFESRNIGITLYKSIHFIFVDTFENTIEVGKISYFPLFTRCYVNWNILLFFLKFLAILYRRFVSLLPFLSKSSFLLTNQIFYRLVKWIISLDLFSINVQRIITLRRLYSLQSYILKTIYTSFRSWIHLNILNLRRRFFWL